MIISKVVAVQQANSLLHLYNYRKLKICTVEETEIVLAGSVLINRSAKGFRLYKEYAVRIVTPLESERLPYVLDIGNQINESYPHRYTDGQLCLETDTAIRIRFVTGFDLEIWMHDFVEPYYFSYEYYRRYGVFPFGERAHGLEGIFQTYGELFGEPENAKIFRLMEFIRFGQYRGHLPCPCGSGEKTRSCHGKFIKKFFENSNLKIIVQSDYKRIKEVLDAYYGQSGNTKSTK